MSIFRLLKQGKGTISSSLGKELAARALDGEISILTEALDLCVYDLPNSNSKHIRAGAAKTVEIVAEKAPELVAPHLESVLPALSAPEPQTRWMILRTCGFCASLCPKSAVKALQAAQSVIENKEGLVLSSSADLFLGDIGAVSRACAERAYPLLKKSSMSLIKNESDWVLEAFRTLSANLDHHQREFVRQFAGKHIDSLRKSTRQRADRLLKLLGSD